MAAPVPLKKPPTKGTKAKTYASLVGTKPARQAIRVGAVTPKK